VCKAVLILSICFCISCTLEKSYVAADLNPKLTTDLDGFPIRDNLSESDECSCAVVANSSDSGEVEIYRYSAKKMIEDRCGSACLIELENKLDVYDDDEISNRNHISWINMSLLRLLNKNYSINRCYHLSIKSTARIIKNDEVNEYATQFVNMTMNSFKLEDACDELNLLTSSFRSKYKLSLFTATDEKCELEINQHEIETDEYKSKYYLKLDNLSGEFYIEKLDQNNLLLSNETQEINLIDSNFVFDLSNSFLYEPSDPYEATNGSTYYSNNTISFYDFSPLDYLFKVNGGLNSLDGEKCIDLRENF
jgi:hypothetical protein